VDDIKIRRLGRAGSILIIEDERVSKNFLMGNFIKNTSGKTKKKMGERPEVHNADPRDRRMEKTSRR
jgi:hypothetical protein